MSLCAQVGRISSDACMQLETDKAAQKHTGVSHHLWPGVARSALHAEVACSNSSARKAMDRHGWQQKHLIY
jgi:hypothetical protein